MLDRCFTMAELKKDGNPIAGIPMAKNPMGSSAAKIRKGSALFIAQAIRGQVAANWGRVALADPLSGYAAQTGGFLFITLDVPKNKLLVCGPLVVRFDVYTHYTYRDLNTVSGRPKGLIQDSVLAGEAAASGLATRSHGG